MFAGADHLQRETVRQDEESCLLPASRPSPSGRCGQRLVTALCEIGGGRRGKEDESDFTGDSCHRLLTSELGSTHLVFPTGQNQSDLFKEKNCWPVNTSMRLQVFVKR